MAKKIYIDAGHGGSDPGAVKYVKEADVNIKVANYMASYLQNNYTCSVKNDISARKLYTICNDANNWGADLFVSIHFNAGGGDGFECFVYNTANTKLGQVFEKHVKNIGQNSRGVKYDPDLIVLNSTNMKAILLECAFVDNWNDIKDWNEDAELKKMGIAYAKAAAEWLALPIKSGKPTTTTTATTGNKTPKKTIAEDGSWGQDTTRNSQRILGCSVIDGIVSNQLYSCKKYLVNMHTSSWEYSSVKRGGSAMVKKLQALVGADQDGYMGVDTVTQLQIFLAKLGLYTGEIDGYAGVLTVTAWQKYVNMKSA